MKDQIEQSVGVVVIGRNEGKRLERCLQSVLKQTKYVVYVDSGSSDDSVKYATSVGVDVVQLSTGVPFSAGRARNDGFSFLVENNPYLEYVQFIDGDCELVEGWVEAARKFLVSNQNYAVVAGRRKERYPEKSIYNTICDIEWNTPVGEAKSCGGDFLAQVAAFKSVKGFNPKIVAGEEPELCYRLRNKGYQVYRFDCLMTLHDAEITKFSQWWKRAVRSGYAYSEGCVLHCMGKERYRFKECLRIWLWGLVIPISISVGIVFAFPWGLLLLGIYLLQFSRLYLASRQKIIDKKIAFICSAFNLIDKFPQLFGQISYFSKRIRRQTSTIIEYK